MTRPANQATSSGRENMKRKRPATGWVVYESSVHVKGRRLAVVCPQDEWDALPVDLRRSCVLIRAGNTNEGEAERQARSHSVGRPRAA